jgi:hypothetical protein
MNKILRDSAEDFICNALLAYIEMVDADVSAEWNGVMVPHNPGVVSTILKDSLGRGINFRAEGVIDGERGSLVVSSDLEAKAEGRVFKPLAAYLNAVLGQVQDSCQGCGCCIPRGSCELPESEGKF